MHGEGRDEKTGSPGLTNVLGLTKLFDLFGFDLDRRIRVFRVLVFCFFQWFG